MNIISLGFLAGLVVLWAGFCLLPNGRFRRPILAAANLTFLALLIPNWISWIALGVFLLSGYAVGRVLAVKPSRIGLVSYLVALVAGFIYLKRYAILPVLLPEWFLWHPIAIVGLSYMFFRQVRFVVDCVQGQIPRPSLPAYLAYQVNLFTLPAGPLQRFNDFQAYWEQPNPIRPGNDGVPLAFLRVLVGFFKIIVLGAASLWLYERAFLHLETALTGSAVGPWRAAGWFALMFYAYPAYVYLNFSGYCDVVIGGASLLGMSLPENFNYPFLARNMNDFWTRWHRTLGFWVRDFLFTPVYKAVAVRKGGSAPGWAAPCYFLAFFVICIWHGTTGNFVVFGLLQGAGVSAAKIWENFLIKRGGREGLHRYLQSRRIRTVAIIANLHFVCMTCLFFPAELDRCLIPIRSLLAALGQCFS